MFRRRPVLRWVVLFQVSMLATMPIQFLLFQPFLRAHGVPFALIGVLTVPVELVGAGGALISGRLVRRVGVHAVGAVAMAGVVGGLLLLAGVDHVGAMVGFVGAAIARGLLFPAIGAYINDRVPSDVRATVLSVTPFGTALVFAVMASVAGVVGDESLRLAFGGTAVGTLLVSGGLLWMWRRAHLADPHGAVVAGSDEAEVASGD
ncbi:MAG: hypothetical protein HOH95_01870 [Dehalococcoidia bacterium]|nr:hypothetical protein [Dehalococcoidia bacterium]